MTPERYKQIGKLYHLALELEPEQRGTFLDLACADDEQLRREVEALLKSDSEAESFLASPAIDLAAKQLAEEQLLAKVGSRVGHYRLLSLLGAGGMGEVYLAEDTRLDRKVALKLLPEAFTKNEDRLRRFVREAKAASALNHPNIITIHEIGQAGQSHYITTEYIHGETLRELLHRRKMTIIESLDVAIQAASALAAAHQAGIVHRDIKPENIMVRRDGYVKVLDFGLAKLTEQPRTSDTSAPTVARIDTDPGTVLGTANYMSPEQAQGRAVDARADIFSLGAVIYEMVSGRPPFEGESSGEIIASILKTEPAPLARFAPEAPGELQRIVSKALRKDREERYQTTKDLLIDLKSLREELAFQERLERSIGPESSGARAIDSGGAAVATAASAAAQTGESAVRTTSSAEYIITEIKRHKVGTLVSLVVLALAVAGLVAYLHARNTEVAIESIAVLPFENFSNDPDAEYISDGIAESVINSLTRLTNLKVIPRSIAFRYKGNQGDLQKIGAELGVNAVLTGRVIQRGDNLTISVELDDVRYGNQLWGEQYNRKVGDLLAMQREISSEVSQRLRVQLTGEERQKLAKGSTENPEAYQLYLRGNYYVSQFTKDGMRKGIDYFNQAIALDPNYALAYDGLAYDYCNMVGWYLPANECMPRAKDAAMRALAIDETLATAHLSLAIVAQWYDWDWASADRQFKRAIELNPKNQRIHGYYSWFLIEALSRVDEAIEEGKQSVELDPVSPEGYNFLGFTFVFARRYDQAIEQLRKGIEQDSTFWLNHDFLGRAYEASGRLPEAIAEFQRALQLENGNGENWSNLAHAYALLGKRSEAQKILDHLKDLSAQNYIDPYFIAAIYSGLRDKEQAFAWLERAYAARSFAPAFYLKSDPQMDWLRADPQFAEIQRRIGFPH